MGVNLFLVERRWLSEAWCRAMAVVCFAPFMGERIRPKILFHSILVQFVIWRLPSQAWGEKWGGPEVAVRARSPFQWAAVETVSVFALTGET